MHAVVRKATKLRLAGPVHSRHSVLLKRYKVSFKHTMRFYSWDRCIISGNYYTMRFKENMNEGHEHTFDAA